jgi:plastocyanin
VTRAFGARAFAVAFAVAVAFAFAVAPGSARATPVRCANPCVVTADTAVYLTPAIEIAGGTTVTWTTNTESHPTSNTITTAQQCFRVAVGDGAPVTPVRFDVVAGTVVATTAPGAPNERSAPCSTATALPSGGYAMQFRCLLHPYMAGEMILDLPA